MPKYFFNNNAAMLDDRISVKGELLHHLLHVLRYKPGRTAIFCDGNGTDYECVYDSHDNKKGTLLFTVTNKNDVFNELPYEVILYQSIIAAGKMELAIQKSVELGVSKIVPVFTKLTAAKAYMLGDRNERWQKIAENAAEQSMRGYIPNVTPPVKFNEAIRNKDEDMLWLTAYENEYAATISQAVNEFLQSQPAPAVADGALEVNNLHGKPLRVGVWVGPEGGFDENEIALLEEAGAITVTLGRRILRAETAGTAALIQLQCALGAEKL